MNTENQAIAKEEHHNAIGKHLPEGFQPATEPLDIPNLPYINRIKEFYTQAKPAMSRHLAQRKRMVLAQQLEIASRYNARFERLHMHDTGGCSCWTAQCGCLAAQHPVLLHCLAGPLVCLALIYVNLCSNDMDATKVQHA